MHILNTEHAPRTGTAWLNFALLVRPVSSYVKKFYFFILPDDRRTRGVYVRAYGVVEARAATILSSSCMRRAISQSVPVSSAVVSSASLSDSDSVVLSLASFLSV